MATAQAKPVLSGCNRTLGRSMKPWTSAGSNSTVGSDEISRDRMRSVMGYLMRGDEISDEIGWDLMGSDEIYASFGSAGQQSSYAVVGLTPRDAGVNAVENSGLTPWKSGVNAVENSGLTPPFKCAQNQVSVFASH